MGQAKHNPTAIAAKKGELPQKKPPMSKRELERRLAGIISRAKLEDYAKVIDGGYLK